MALSYDYSYSNDSATTAFSKSISPLSYADYNSTKTSDSELIQSDVKADIDLPGSIRYAIQDIKNVYTGTDIDPALFSAQKRGKSVVVGIRDSVRVTDSDLKTEVAYPIEAHLVFKFPLAANITAAQVAPTLNRLYAGLFKTADDTTRVNSLMHGVLDPAA